MKDYGDLVFAPVWTWRVKTVEEHNWSCTKLMTVLWSQKKTCLGQGLQNIKYSTLSRITHHGKLVCPSHEQLKLVSKNFHRKLARMHQAKTAFLPTCIKGQKEKKW